MTLGYASFWHGRRKRIASRHAGERERLPCDACPVRAAGFTLDAYGKAEANHIACLGAWMVVDDYPLWSGADQCDGLVACQLDTRQQAEQYIRDAVAAWKSPAWALAERYKSMTTMSETTWRDTLADADQLVTEIMERDAEMPGFAPAIVAAIVARLGPAWESDEVEFLIGRLISPCCSGPPKA